MKSVKLKALAKVNLDLRVLNRRGDGFHELRTVFQTISLADTIEIQFEKARRTRIEIEGNVEIADNLIFRAAEAILDRMRVRARVHFRLEKRIPMGAGLGGGSSDAAAMLLTLPVLAGRPVAMENLIETAAQLGSYVPFFLAGGTAVAIGRGTEFYSLPDVAEQEILVVSTGVHVSTAEAYRALGRGLTFPASSSSINSFQALVRALGELRAAGLASALSRNDFEAVVFKLYPKLQKIRGRLSRSGAAGARMTGSGSAIFGIYDSAEGRERARKRLEGEQLFRGCVMPAKLVSGSGYRRMWRRQLRDFLDPDDKLWPPRDRYAR
ncbi:MAG: 4-(cytidine 5'-diphospho)-2-C-methyl-D-erythritol kinase [Bryobacteraceae bacterium]